MEDVDNENERLIELLRRTIWRGRNGSGLSLRNDLREAASTSMSATASEVRLQQIERERADQFANNRMLTPAGADISENMRLALENRNNPIWFYEHVRNGGPWDYKQTDPGYEAFGNFNFGVTGRAAGFSDETLERMAGWAQTRAKTSEEEYGIPPGLVASYLGVGGKRPYGDDPIDNGWVRRGIDYYDTLVSGARRGGGTGW